MEKYILLTLSSVTRKNFENLIIRYFKIIKVNKRAISTSDNLKNYKLKYLVIFLKAKVCFLMIKIGLCKT